VPFRENFDCLWCGREWTTRAGDDLEGWAALCPDCLGRAQDNDFLRYRLKAAIRDRAAAMRGPVSAGTETLATEKPPTAGAASSVPRTQLAPGAAPEVVAEQDDEMKAYYAARAPEYDDWYLRRGRYSRGPVRDLAWHGELDAVTRWLDALPIAGEIVELAAGTGWWSPLLAQKGELSIYDGVPEPLDLARKRLVAHDLRAHLHVRDAWDEPDRQVDTLFCGFWLSHVPRDRLAPFLKLAARWIKPGGIFAFIDSRSDPESGAVDHDPVAADETSLRRLEDGREFRIPKVYYSPSDLRDALLGTGFAEAMVTQTARFFVTGWAKRESRRLGSHE
jgi:demethylmenaquinone methyltransferase/2-methoxy-6-polyprenyl-1,4-benzoquinol methylase